MEDRIKALHEMIDNLIVPGNTGFAGNLEIFTKLSFALEDARNVYRSLFPFPESKEEYQKLKPYEPQREELFRKMNNKYKEMDRAMFLEAEMEKSKK